MKFRPCIDIHNGKVKQIVGNSLRDQGNLAVENFVAEQNADYFSDLYRRLHLPGGHVILLNSRDSEYYEATRRQAFLALETFRGGLQAGGGITQENAASFLDAGASHVIVTSYVFNNGRISFDRLEKLRREVGREHLTLDLSCRRKEDQYFIVTDRWQKFTDVAVSVPVLSELSSYCDEFLIHAVDVEGKSSGIETPLVRLLAQFSERPVTYAGGVGTFEDLELLRTEGRNRIDVTIGSALDLFGGPMSLQEVLKKVNQAG